VEKKSKISVNLSSRKQITVGNIFLKWAFEAGRAIVILIELIALSALGYRLLVDGQIVDLHEKIDNEAALVGFQANDEKAFRGIHERLENIRIINEETKGKVQVMDDILSAINVSEFTETSLTVNQSSVALSGNALSVFTVENFVNKIQEYPQINSITIDEINTSSSGIKFSLRIALKESQLDL